jgi:N-terminal acetyltransferase B complex non-catalytic subunit
MIRQFKINHDFVLNVAKRVTEARKKVQEGLGKGVAKLCTTYLNA